MDLDVFEFLLELISPDIVHAAQFVELAQSQLGLAKIVQAWLAVVLRHILVSSRAALV